MKKDRKYRTLESTGIQNRLKSLKPTVTELSDAQLYEFLKNLAETKRADAISEFDVIAKQGLVDEAASLDIAAERLLDLVDYLDQGETKRTLGMSEA